MVFLAQAWKPIIALECSNIFTYYCHTGRWTQTGNFDIFQFPKQLNYFKTQTWHTGNTCVFQIEIISLFHHSLLNLVSVQAKE